MRFNLIKKDKTAQLPKTPGIYVLKRGDKFLYIGKATNIQKRVKNHLKQKNFRDGLFINKVNKIGFIKTDSEIEALILEANLIKKRKPKYNIFWRDDKNFFYVGVTREDFPKIFITHQPSEVSSSKYQAPSKRRKKILNTNFIGPFVDGKSLKQTLRLLRGVFPYYSRKKHPRGLCSWCYLGLCPGPNPDKKSYQKNIKNLVAVLKGKNKSVLKKLEKEMKEAAFSKQYEKAATKRDQLRALKNILAHARVFESPLESKKLKWPKIQKQLKKIIRAKKKISRLEAYDVSNIRGKKATGSMVTFIKGKPDKNFYRRFRIKISGKPNDIAMIKELLSRRLKHQEWKLPDLILIDGGRAQLNAGKIILNQKKLKIPVIALAKGENKLFVEERKKPLFLKTLPDEVFNFILRARDEAHRFALKYHRKLRMVDLREGS
jgi:excinuclease ABC subunit C